MGSILYDFLSDSSLFRDQAISSKFDGYSDGEIKAELSRYRQYCLETLPATDEEIAKSPSNLRVFSDAERPSISHLKQTSLYIEQHILTDPLLPLTMERNEQSFALAQSIGFTPPNIIDREELSGTLSYLKSITPMVAADYIKFFPVSYFFEPPAQLPMNASDNYFSDVLPEGLLKWFRDRAKVSSMRKVEEGWAIDNKLYPCRAINVSFQDADSSWAYSYPYFSHEIIPESYDEETHQFTGKFTFSYEPLEINHFNAWVFQSINQAAKAFFDRISFQVSVAATYGALYLSDNKFVFDLLQQELGTTSSIRSHTVNTVLRLQLPFLENVTIDDLMRIRMEDGEVFQTFRLELDKRFQDLRLVQDENELKMKTENILHDLIDVEIRAVDRQIRSLRKRHFTEAALAAAGLMGAVHTAGWSLIGAVTAAISGYKSYQDYQDKVRENPAFFMWKVLKGANRRKGLRQGSKRRF